MNFKPGEVFVGIIAFFAVLLPGAILAFLFLNELQILFAPQLAQLPDATTRWAVFLVGAYLAGSFVVLVAALMDRQYDRVRRLVFSPHRDRLFRHARAIKTHYVRDADHEMINTFKWARALLQLHSSSGTAELDRLEAEQKFFRSLFVVLGFAFVRRIWPNFWPDGVWLLGVLVVLFGRVWFPFGWFKRRRTWRLWQVCLPFGPRAPGRWLAVGLIALLLVLLRWRFEAIWLELMALLGLLGLVFWRYFDQRWKCTQLAYTYLVILERKPPKG
jgi:hypothetical protein